MKKSTYLFLIVITLIPIKLFSETLEIIKSTPSNLKYIGKVIVTDGDTIRKGNLKIRLHGIDAPEYKQKCKNSEGQFYACGIKSSDFLKSVINTNDVYCKGKNTDRYGRLIAICFVNPAPNESVLATIIPSSTPNSRNAYLTAFIFARKSECGTVTFPS